MARNAEEPVELYRTRGGTEAQVLRSFLEEAGIDVRIDNDMLNGIVGEVPAGWVTSPRVLVRNEQLAAAQEVLNWFLKDTEAARTQDDGQARCLACSKLMGDEVKCPDCGWTFQTDEEPD